MTDVPRREIDPYEAGVAARIRAVRRQRGLTLTQAAERLEVSYQQFQKYEAGANRISAGSLHKLAKFFDVPIHVFFEGQRDGRAGVLTDPLELQLLQEFRNLPSPEHQRWIVSTLCGLPR